MSVSALTISQLNQMIKGVLEPRFSQVWVQGEIGNLRPAQSGHLYFSLKDSGAVISAAWFGFGSRSGKQNGLQLKEGMQVLCRGKISVYAPRGSYQISVDQVEPLGAGNLQIQFEELKAKLESEGLFRSERKRPMPRYVKKIAIITSPSGAAIRDILQVLERRAPQIEVKIIPALMQGLDAVGQVIEAIAYANRENVADVLLLTRGGGSQEDLWCFNDERLVRALGVSAIPTVSAIGHEIDFTLSDFIADYRAPTPSAAAEVLSQDWVNARQILKGENERLLLWVQRWIYLKRISIENISGKLVSPVDRLREQSQKVDDLTNRLIMSSKVLLERKQNRFARAMSELDALSPLRVLERGYSLVRTPLPESTVIRSSAQVNEEDVLDVLLAQGTLQVRVLERLLPGQSGKSSSK